MQRDHDVGANLVPVVFVRFTVSILPTSRGSHVRRFRPVRRMPGEMAIEENADSVYDSASSCSILHTADGADRRPYEDLVVPESPPERTVEKFIL